MMICHLHRIFVRACFSEHDPGPPQKHTMRKSWRTWRISILSERWTFLNLGFYHFVVVFAGVELSRNSTWYTTQKKNAKTMRCGASRLKCFPERSCPLFWETSNLWSFERRPTILVKPHMFLTFDPHIAELIHHWIESQICWCFMTFPFSAKVSWFRVCLVIRINPLLPQC